MNELVSANNQERNLASAAHLSTLLGYMIPMANIIAPLVIFLTKKQESSFITQHAREALNFQITITILVLISIPLLFIVIGIPMLIALWIFDLVYTIKATIKANDGEMFRYPYTLRLVK